MSSKDRQVSKKVAKEVKERDKWCFFCGRPTNLTIAHYIGRGRGGLGIKENLGVLCMACHHDLDNGHNTTRKAVIKTAFRNRLEKFYPDFKDEDRVERNKWDTREF